MPREVLAMAANVLAGQTAEDTLILFTQGPRPTSLTFHRRRSPRKDLGLVQVCLSRWGGEIFPSNRISEFCVPAASSTAFAKLAKVPDRAESPASPMMRSLYYPTGSSFMPLPTIGRMSNSLLASICTSSPAFNRKYRNQPGGSVIAKLLPVAWILLVSNSGMRPS